MLVKDLLIKKYMSYAIHRKMLAQSIELCTFFSKIIKIRISVNRYSGRRSNFGFCLLNYILINKSDVFVLVIVNDGRIL